MSSPSSSRDSETPSSTAAAAASTTAQSPSTTTTTKRSSNPLHLETNPALKPQAEQYRRLFYYSALGVVVGAPVVALMPPRKFDLFTFGLGITWCMSAGFVSQQKTGQGLLWHVGMLVPSQANKERKERARKEEEMVEKSRRSGQELTRDKVAEMVRENERWHAERRKKMEEAGLVPVKKRGFFKSLWMGKEGDDWVQERQRREQEALDEGRGYTGLMTDYIREAFGIKPDNDEGDDDKGQ